ncbi:MAG: flagellar motor switch protein FliG [Gammaproteobacteria bacterium]|nr:flagellar motor switch protein FliG [Gammaproteobacteria bacterium]
MATEAASGLSAVERAAILLLTLGEAEASEVLKHIGPKEVHKVSLAMASLKNVSTDQANTVLEDFMDTFETETAFGMGSHEYLKKILVNALGEDKASNIIDRIQIGDTASGLEQLKWMDPRSIMEMIRGEHPQIIAVVLAYLESDQAADVIGLLPENIRSDVVLRIATLDRLQPSALLELNQVIERQFLGNQHGKSSTVGGVKSAANILNLMDTTIEAAIMDQVAEYDQDLSDQLNDLMFVFDDLVEVDNRGVQRLLREIGSEQLVFALKGADQTLKDKIFENMSKRAAEMLQDDLEARGPVKLSEVEAAQKEILVIARRLAESGEMSLGSKGGEEYV